MSSGLNGFNEIDKLDGFHIVLEHSIFGLNKCKILFAIDCLFDFYFL